MPNNLKELIFIQLCLKTLNRYKINAKIKVEITVIYGFILISVPAMTPSLVTGLH